MIMKIDDRFIAVIRRDDCRLDFKKLKKRVEVAKSIRMANDEEFEK